jgi:hypothetical protein
MDYTIEKSFALDNINYKTGHSLSLFINFVPDKCHEHHEKFYLYIILVVLSTRMHFTTERKWSIPYQAD